MFTFLFSEQDRKNKTITIMQAIEKRFILISFGKINGKLFKGFDGGDLAKLFFVQKINL
jgi:hypothetical protein